MMEFSEEEFWQRLVLVNVGVGVTDPHVKATATITEWKKAFGGEPDASLPPDMHNVKSSCTKCAALNITSINTNACGIGDRAAAACDSCGAEYIFTIENVE